VQCIAISMSVCVSVAVSDYLLAS